MDSSFGLEETARLQSGFFGRTGPSYFSDARRHARFRARFDRAEPMLRSRAAAPVGGCAWLVDRPEGNGSRFPAPSIVPRFLRRTVITQSSADGRLRPRRPFCRPVYKHEHADHHDAPALQPIGPCAYVAREPVVDGARLARRQSPQRSRRHHADSGITSLALAAARHSPRYDRFSDVARCVRLSRCVRRPRQLAATPRRRHSMLLQPWPQAPTGPLASTAGADAATVEKQKPLHVLTVRHVQNRSKVKPCFSGQTHERVWDSRRNMRAPSFRAWPSIFGFEPVIWTRYH